MEEVGQSKRRRCFFELSHPAREVEKVLRLLIIPGLEYATWADGDEANTTVTCVRAVIKYPRRHCHCLAFYCLQCPCIHIKI